MRLDLNDMSPLPLREQIVCGIREMILSGDLPEHFQLPSIRGFAQDQRVGAVTVQRAYEDLQRERMIYARQGKGFFVAPLDREDRKDLAATRAAEKLQGPVSEALAMGLTAPEILDLVRRALASDPGLADSAQKED
jgi:GntR family transcriptional regulator